MSPPLIQKVWNYATVLRNEGIHYGAYISQISFLLFLKMDDERSELIGEPSVLPKDCRWKAIKDLQGQTLSDAYARVLDKLSRREGPIGSIFLKAKTEIEDPAKLRRLVTLIDGEQWMGLSVDTKGAIYEGLLELEAVPNPNAPAGIEIRQKPAAPAVEDEEGGFSPDQRPISKT